MAPSLADQPDERPRPQNSWQRLRIYAELSITISEVLNLRDQLQAIATDSGFTARRQPASRMPRTYAADSMDEDSDAESEVDPADGDDDGDGDYMPSESRARRIARVQRMTATRPAVPVGRRRPVPSTSRLDEPQAPSAIEPVPPAEYSEPRTARHTGNLERRGDLAQQPSRSNSPPPSLARTAPSLTTSSVPDSRSSPRPSPETCPSGLKGKRKRRGAGVRAHSRKTLTPEQRASLKKADKARRGRRASRLYAALMAADVTARRMRSQTQQAAADRGISAARLLGLIDSASETLADFPLSSILHGSSLFTNAARIRPEDVRSSSPRGKEGAPALHPRCNSMVRELVERDGYTYIKNDLSRVQVCLSADEKMFAIKAKQPVGNWYREAIARVGAELGDLRERLRLGGRSTNRRHTRGRFPRFTFGVSHGGGQKKPTKIAPDSSEENLRLIMDFLRDENVQAVVKHVQSCVFTWCPDVAAYYKELEKNMNVDDAIRSSVLFNLPFAAHTLNLGPYVQCWFHRDARNFILGFCPVLVLGSFDHETSGQFVMVEPKIVLELRPGDVLLMMSAVITHGTAPLRRGETRMSWTCFSAGGLFRWWAAGSKLVADLTSDEKTAYDLRSQELFIRGWNAILSLDQLKERALAEAGRLTV